MPNIYKKEVFMDEEERQVIQLTNIDTNEVKYLASIYLMTPMGVDERQFMLQEVTSLTSAFEKYDAQIKKVSDELREALKKEMQKQRLQVAQDMPPTKPNSGLILS